MITARQSRAARALLGWTQETLADKALVSLTALKRLKSVNGLEVYERRAIRCAGPLRAAASSFCPPTRGRGDACPREDRQAIAAHWWAERRRWPSAARVRCSASP